MESLPENNIKLPENLAVITSPGEAAALTTFLGPPVISNLSDTKLLNGSGSQGGEKKTPAKKAKKVADGPAKPRPPRVRKPPTTPRSRAKPQSAANSPVIMNAPITVEPMKMVPSGFMTQNFPNNGQIFQQQLPPAQRTTRVLLPKPASGQVGPARPILTQNVVNNSVQFQNGMMVLGQQSQQPPQQQQQQFMPFRTANGQFQSVDVNSNTSGGKIVQTGQQVIGQHQLNQNTGKPQQMVMVNLGGGGGGGQNLMQIAGGMGQPSGPILHPANQSTGKMMFVNSSGQPIAGGSPRPQMMTSMPSVPQMPSNNPSQPNTVAMRVQTIQTANGPMMLAFFPDQNGSGTFSVGMDQQQQQQRIPIQQTQINHLLDQSTGDGLNRTGTPPNFNFLASPSQPQMMQRPMVNINNNMVSVSSLANSYQQPPSMRDIKEDKPPSEPEFNIEEFLMPGIFTSQSASSATQEGINNQSILEEMVSGPLFQSQAPPAPVVAAKPKRKRPPKKDNSSVKQVQKVEFKNNSENKNLKKVEEILKNYTENMDKTSRPVIPDALPSAPFLLSTPVASSTVAPPPALVLPPPLPPPIPPPPPTKSKAKGAAAARRIPIPVQPPVPVPVQPVIVKPVTPPLPVKSPTPPPPPRPKTDLAVRAEKEEKVLDKLSGKPFKGPNSAINRLLPFHLLAQPDDPPELIERESRAFRHVAESLLERQVQLYSRFGQYITQAAANPLPKLDILTSNSTWLDIEHAELESDKAAVEQGIERIPPAWVYQPDLQLDADIPYHDGNLLLGFTEPEPEPVEDVPSPPVIPAPPPPLPVPDRPPATITAVFSPETGGKLKLRIKRPASTASIESREPPPKKISLTLKMSAKAGWVVGRTGVAIPATSVGSTESPLPLLTDGPVEDVATRNAVDSILNPAGLMARTVAARSSAPVMMTNGGDDFMEMTGGQFGQFMEPDTDMALNEAINSILG